MSRWFRVYDDLVNDPKVQRLEPALFKFLINIWCLTSQNGGTIPCVENIQFALREPDASLVVASLEALVCLGLADRFSNQHTTWLAPHAWHKRQYKSDTSTDRVKRFRNVSASVSPGVSETPPETEYRGTESERKKDNTARAVSTTKEPYAFESGVIRLNEKDFNQWKKAFSHLDLAAELVGLTSWAGEQGQKWFCAVSGALTKKNREIGIRLEQQKAGAPAFKWNGIEGVT